MKTVRRTVFNEQYFVWVSKHSYKFAPSKTSHRDVLEICLAAHCNKEGRSCSPLLETLSRFSPPAPFGTKGDFALCGARPKGSALWTSAAFEKA
ncbi:MAG: hypothetical protein K2J11_05470, partial [Oscillospiraceae bacterium]|nr:hypothetical protein [Oscillospiraceae bacterium]